MEIRDCIYQRSNFLEEAHFKSFYNYIKDLSSYQEAQIVGSLGESGGVDTKIRSTKICGLARENSSLTNNHWYNFLRSKIFQEVENYSKKIRLAELRGDMDINILKYITGDFYVYHIDDGHKTPRTISIIILINDDYEGGELCFLSPDQKQEITVKTEKNKIIMWPSNFLYPHAVKKVTKGVRYSIVSWIR